MTLAKAVHALRLGSHALWLPEHTEIRNLKITQVTGWGTVTFFEAEIVANGRVGWHAFYVNGTLAIEE